MALNPQIALGVAPPPQMNIQQWGQLANLGAQNELIRQQAASARAAEAETLARTPGVAAESDIKRREADFLKWQTNNAKEFTRPDGSIDPLAFVRKASADGYFTEAQAVAAKDLDNKGKDIANRKNAVEADTAARTYLQSSAAYVSQLLHNAPEKERPALLKQYSEFLEKTVPGSGDFLVQSFGKPDQKTGVMGVDKDRVKAYRDATMTPLEQTSKELAAEELKLRQQQQVFDFAKESFTTEGRDPNSGISRRSRELAKQVGVKVPDNVSAFELNRIPGLVDKITEAARASVVPVELRAQGAAEEAAAKVLVNQYDNSLKVISGLDKTILGTKLGEIGSSAYQKYVMQNPGLAALETMIQVHNEQFKNDPINTMTQTVGEIAAKLRAGRAQLGVKEKSGGKLKEQQTFRGETEKPAAESAPTAPTGKLVKMTKYFEHNGKNQLGEFDESQVPMLEGLGWKRVSKAGK